MWSKRLMRMVMAGMAVLVWSTSVAAQECQRPPAKIAALTGFVAQRTRVMLFCDKAKAPACAVTFRCGSIVHTEDPATWDMSVEPGRMFRYEREYWGNCYQNNCTPAPGSFVEALTNGGWTPSHARGLLKACVVRSNDPVEIRAIQLVGSMNYGVSERISPPEPYPCLSSNAALSGLTVSEEGTLRPSFNSDTTDYTFTTRATRVAFTPTAADSGATIRVNNTVVQSGVASGNLAVPWPRLPITVTAEDGTTTRTYYVTTTRFGS